MTDIANYGAALYELAREENIEDLIKNELAEITDVFSQNPEIITLLDSSGIKFDTRKKIVTECFGSAHKYALNFLYILTQKRITHLFPECVRIYNEKYNIDHNIEHITAVTAVPMTDDEKKTLTLMLQKKRRSQVILKNSVEPDILGGIIIRGSDLQTDASLSGRLKRASEALHKEKNYGY